MAHTNEPCPDCVAAGRTPPNRGVTLCTEEGCRKIVCREHTHLWPPISDGFQRYVCETHYNILATPMREQLARAQRDARRVPILNWLVPILAILFVAGFGLLISQPEWIQQLLRSLGF